MYVSLFEKEYIRFNRL